MKTVKVKVYGPFLSPSDAHLGATYVVTSANEVLQDTAGTVLDLQGAAVDLESVPVRTVRACSPVDVARIVTGKEDATEFYISRSVRWNYSVRWN